MRFNKNYLFWIPVIFVMILIFIFSGEKGVDSTNLSRVITTDIVDKFSTNLSAEQEMRLIVTFETYIRKTAHFLEYTILLISILIALYNAHSLRNKKLCITALGIAVAYACTDEFHQLFVPGRTGRLFDIFIDSCGALFGILCFYLIMYIVKRGIAST